MEPVKRCLYRLKCSTRVVNVYLALAVICIAQNAYAQKEFDGIRGTHKWMMFSDAPNALYHSLANQAFHYLNLRSAQVESLQTLADWQRRKKQVQTNLMEALGRFPEKTALKPVVTNIVKKVTYKIENLYFESQPGFYVTASMFIPTLKNRKKMPAIVYCSGHSEAGYRAISYQHTILNLVDKGFVVLAFDPIGQGERLQYPNPKTGKSKFEYPSFEHSYAGAQLFMTGNSLAKYMVWDGIRAIDYLCTRKEIDTARIGITGRSGGGTQSAFIAALDPRIKAVAPENYFTSFTRLYQSMGPQDAEQNLLGGIKKGLEMADLLVAYAPKPALMITTTRDMFPIQGAMETAAEVSKMYVAYGKATNFKLTTDDAPHAATKKNREAMYAFFQKFLRLPGDSIDHDLLPLKPQELKVTATGQVASALASETAFSLNKKQAELLLQTMENSRHKSGYLEEILASAKKYSGFRTPEPVNEAVFTGRIQRKDYIIEKYFIKGEGDYTIPYLLMTPNKPTSKAIIYLNPKGKAKDSDEGGTMESLVKNGFVVLAPDLLGYGEMGPGIFKGDSYIDSVSYNLWFAAALVERSIVGMHASDIVKLENLLTKHNIKEVYALAYSAFTPALLHAAAFDKAIQKVALIRPYSSYQSIITHENYHPGFLYSTVAGSAGKYDLPDLMNSIAPRKLLLFGVTDGTGVGGDIQQDLQIVDKAYRQKKDGLELVADTASLPESLKHWLK